VVLDLAFNRIKEI